MATQCHSQLTLSFQPKIVLDFNGGEISSDSGLLLLRQFDAQLALTKKLAGLLNDWRYQPFIEHHTHEMLCQRIYQIAAGYHDQNDADTLRSDATFQTIVARSDPLASQPTLSRLENHADWQSIRRLGDLCLKWFLHHGYGKNEHPEEILLDSDSTDDPCHGQQQLAFFHGKYGEHMYHPLFFFEAKTGALLSARLRAGNASASEGIAAELRRLVAPLKRRFPKSQISYRADAGSATPAIYQTLESLDMLYAIGIGTNAVFKRKTEPWLKKAKRKYAVLNNPLGSFTVSAIGLEAGEDRDGSWSRSKWAPWVPIYALLLPTEQAGPNRSLPATTSGASAKTGSRNLSAILARTDFPATAIAPMPFAFSSMPSLTSCSSFSVSMPLEKPNSLTPAWKPYGLNCLKSVLALNAVRATSGFISPPAGPDASCSWKSGINLNALRLRPLKFLYRKYHGGLLLSTDNSAGSGVFFKTRFSLAS